MLRIKNIESENESTNESASKHSHDDEKNEDIDEDMAFNEQDEEEYENWFEPKKEPKSYKKVDKWLEDKSKGNESESDASSDNDEKHRKLLEKITNKVNAKKGNFILQESRPESTQLVLASRDGKLHLGDLMAAMKKKMKSTIHSYKILEEVEAKRSIGAPTRALLKEKQLRRATYQKAVEDIKKWDPIIKMNKNAATIEYVLPIKAMEKSGVLQNLNDGFEPRNKLEKQITELLKKSGIENEDGIIELEDTLAMKNVSVEKLTENRERLLKMRKLLYQEELKRIRLSKIKSKNHHSRMKRSNIKKALKFSDLPTDEVNEELLEKMEYNRAKERVMQKHSFSNKFTKRALLHGINLLDPEKKQSYYDQLRLAQELKRKTKITKNSSDDDDDDTESDESNEEEDNDSDNKGDNYQKSHKKIMDVLDGKKDPNDVPKFGIMRLPFMQRAMDRQKEKTKTKAMKILDDLKSSDDEKLSDDDEKLSESSDENQKSEKMQLIEENYDNNSSSDSENEKDDIKINKAEKETLNNEQKKDNNKSKNENQEDLKISRECTAAKDYLFKLDKEPENQAEKDDNITKEIIDKEINKSTRNKEEIEIDIDNEIIISNPKSSSMPILKEKELKNIEHSMPSQEELISMAFAGDDVGAEFEEEKKKAIEDQLPELKDPEILLGWGDWASEQVETKEMKIIKKRNEKLKRKAEESRKDANKKRVIINENACESMKQYQISELPFEFKTECAYKMNMDHPLGHEFNTNRSFNELIRPKVVKNTGVIIEPMKFDENFEANVNMKIIKCSKIASGKIHRIVEKREFLNAEKKKN